MDIISESFMQCFRKKNERIELLKIDICTVAVMENCISDFLKINSGLNWNIHWQAKQNDQIHQNTNLMELLNPTEY